MTRTVVGRRTKYVVLLFWVVLIAVAGPLAGKMADVQENDNKAWLPGNAESTKLLDEQRAFQSPNTMSAVVVYERTSGLTAADRAQIQADIEEFPEVGKIDGKISGPLLSEDGQAAQVILPLDLGKDGWNQAGDAADKINAITENDSGLAAYLTGQAGFAADSIKAFEGVDGTLLYAAAAVVIIALLITYRSPILWILPVLSAAVALFSAQALIYLLARYADLTVNGQSAGILTVLVFGAGTDYALLLVARYREELRTHADRHEAMALALHRAGPAIVASAATVALSMLCLLLAEMNSTAGLGPVAAVGIAVALLAMTTLLPALLVICGRWVFWPYKPRFGSSEPTANGAWARTGRRIARHPRRVWVGTTLVLAALSFGLVGLDANGLSNKDSFRKTVDSVVGEEAVARHFEAGQGTPVVVIANSDRAGDVSAAFADTEGIAAVSPPVVRDGLAYFEGTMQAAPDSDAGFDTVDRVRESVHAVPGAEALVGGTTAINLDIKRASQHDQKVLIPIVLLAVFLILAVLLRALLAPVILIATVVLSFATALGISALFFKYAFDFGGTGADFPLFVFVFLVALGIDYNIFLMTRVREEAAKHGTRPGALTALAATGGVITSAGFVLAGTFAVLGTLDLTAFAEIGFAVALGVLLDTLVVRSVLVTALNLDIGGAMWWPSELAKHQDDRDVRREQAAEPDERVPVS